MRATLLSYSWTKIWRKFTGRVILLSEIDGEPVLLSITMGIQLLCKSIDGAPDALVSLSGNPINLSIIDASVFATAGIKP